MNLKSLIQHLVTKEKALFKSATIWLAALVTSLPMLLPEVQANFASFADYIPAALRSKVMYALGAAIFLCRLRSLIKIPQQGLPDPAPGTSH